LAPKPGARLSAEGGTIAALANGFFGTKLPLREVGASVAIGGKAVCSRAPARGEARLPREKATSINESYGAGETGVARRHGLTSQQAVHLAAAGQADRSVCAGHIRPGGGAEPAGASPASAGHWRLDLDWPARVAEVAPHFVAHRSTKFVRQGCMRRAR
jgi:hypothetical protein